MELNYAGLVFKNAIEKNPDVFSLEGVNERIAQTIAKSQATASINAAARAEKDTEGLELEREYNELRLKLHSLKEELRGCENQVNEHAAKIRNTDKQLTTLKIMLAAATEANNPLQEKAIKHLITKAECELIDAKNAHHLACRYNRKAVKQLREFDTARIDDLRKQIEAKRTFNNAHAEKLQTEHEQSLTNARNGVRG